MKQLRVGIIGTGSIADSCHAPAVSAVSRTSLVAVLSRDESRGKDFLHRHGADAGIVHTSLDSFATDPTIQAAIVCSPDRLHVDQARACLANGKHVLLEKPMAVDAQNAQELVELAAANHLTLATGFHLRSHVGHLALHSRIVSDKAIGVLRHVRIIWAFPQAGSNWRAHDTLAKWWSLSAVGPHCIDLARWFSGDMDEWTQFSSVISRNMWNGPHDETAVIAAQLRTGPTVEVVTSIQFGTYLRLELFGDEGQAICDGTLGREGAGTIRINDELMGFEPMSPFIGQLDNFVDCVETRATPRADGYVGLRSVRDLLLAYDPPSSGS